MKKITKSLALGVAALSVAASGAFAGEWPERPVTIIAAAGAGGGTDGVARILANHLKERLGQQFNVVNQGQAGGVVGITNMANAEPDGYTIGLIYNFAHYKLLGQADFDYKSFRPIAQVNFDPAAFQVANGSDWQDMRQALDAIKADPGAYSIGCGGGCGGSWPIAVATLLDQWKVDLSKVNMVPGKGAAAAMQDMVAGGFDAVPCSLPEAEALIDAGEARSLAVFKPERLAKYPDVPTLKEATGLDLELGAWRGIVAPAGLPDEIATKLEAALDEIAHDPKWIEEMNSRGFGIRWRNSAEFTAFVKQHTDEVAAVLPALGLN
ncbi:Bug family tripartite tricarboxylate transporter substrate binding protein [Polycladidibacter hongkongensis]|uniref:Bug family tripartite tricarboxylate transporter substrate binding protein n=1 Tax=Polycladidibacter hongkongensis TaxID=1647556 RepID=UPI000830FBC0|nr:tripartite tricarboxylate transporter substrate binding protein [Pseudovibrio hongkongensis]